MKKFLLSNTTSIVFNLFLMIFLLLAIQNNYEKRKVSFLRMETIEMPISFIIGTSYIIGSLTGNLFCSIVKFKGK